MQSYFNIIFYQWSKPAKALHTTHSQQSPLQRPANTGYSSNLDAIISYKPLQTGLWF